MGNLWRGTWATRIRVASGLVLMLYVLLHFINIGLGVFGPDAMDAFQDARQVFTRSLVGGLLIYGALLAHGALALWRLASRGTLRMPAWEAVQTVLGFLIPLALVDHIVFTRIAHEVYDVNDSYGYLIGLIWGTADGRMQNLLMLVVWIHGCIGMHFWLAGQTWWRRYMPALSGFAALVPGFAFVGYLAEGQRVAAVIADPEARATLREMWNWPTTETFMTLLTTASMIWWTVGGFLLLAAIAFLGRKAVLRRKSVRISYIDGPEINAAKGTTLLEMSRANGVPHTSLCGGRGRCTTCRVILEEGADLIHPPSAAEARSLRAVGAPPNARLACQIRPTNPMTVFRVFQPDGKRGRAHASQGTEQELAVLFLDIRGFTARTTGQLPYDVVFLLNRFFDAIVPAVTNNGGTVDKYLGDGFLALFETRNAESSARAALTAVQEIGQALEDYNARMQAEGAQPIAIGLGLHLGDVVIGEIGATGNAPRTLIGDTVNTASRLESKTKELGVQLLISDSVLQAAGYDTAEASLQALELRGLDAPLSALALHRSLDLDTTLAALPRRESPAAAE